MLKRTSFANSKILSFDRLKKKNIKTRNIKKIIFCEKISTQKNDKVSTEIMFRDIIVESGDVITVTIMPCEVFAQLTR